MASMDVFNGNAFGTTALTAAINMAPYKPHLLGSLNLFKPRPVFSPNVWVESKENTLAILATAPRGTVDDVHSTAKRKGRNFSVPHVPYYANIMADDILGLRAFGSETELETVAGYVNDVLGEMRANHEVTHEFHRVGALKGTVLDADNTTTLVNFYTEFGTSQQTENWNTGNDFTTIPIAATRKIANALGATPFGQIIALCGDTYFDEVVKHSSVKTAYERWMNGEYLRVQHLGPEWYSLAVQGFMFQGVMFINYRGVIGNVTFIPATEAYYFPTNVPDMFLEVMAPGDMMGVVGTRGRRLYSSQQPLNHDKGRQLHTQSNVLFVNTRPRAVIKSTVTVA